VGAIDRYPGLSSLLRVTRSVSVRNRGGFRARIGVRARIRIWANASFRAGPKATFW
jgi:hypothetical protein